MGTSSFLHFNQSFFEDHPHAYGDKRLFGGNKHGRLGSSPRVWGQGYTKNLNVNNGGIIPTRMGTRLANKNNPTETEDHPHAYGDKKPTD